MMDEAVVVGNKTDLLHSWTAITSLPAYNAWLSCVETIVQDGSKRVVREVIKALLIHPF